MQAHVTIKIPLSLIRRKLPPEKDIRSVKIEDGHLVITSVTEVPDHLGPIILTDEEYLKQKRDGTLFGNGK